MTFVRTRLALDRMAPGSVLLVKLRGEEPLRNVPRTAAEQGHEVLSLETGPDGVSDAAAAAGSVTRMADKPWPELDPGAEQSAAPVPQ